jgi:hypothetical protein
MEAVPRENWGKSVTNRRKSEGERTEERSLKKKVYESTCIVLLPPMTGRAGRRKRESNGSGVEGKERTGGNRTELRRGGKRRNSSRKKR